MRFRELSKGIGNRESGIGNRESGIGKLELGIGKLELGKNLVYLITMRTLNQNFPISLSPHLPIPSSPHTSLSLAFAFKS
ncbi:MAG: hypothetical protein F6K26_46845 [Moorea sp. SIO2I5]|nr:hypothetical protein [Moorena sp. SIO2I5]